jgi:preprotein translocase subunit SecB
MSEITAGQLSGINFDWVVARELRFVDNPLRTERTEVKQLQIGVEVKAAVSNDGRACTTTLRIQVKPPEGSDDFQIISATVEGHFSAPGASTVSMHDFANKQAAAILMPFVRQEIATLTARSRLGQVLVPPINVVALVEQIAKEKQLSQAQPNKPIN